MAIRKLIDLDFAPGIKSEHLNFNFQLIYDWLRRERLRVGGWGIVEGFDLSYDPNFFTITVGQGVVINHDGDEVTIDEHTFNVSEPSYNRVTRTYTVDSMGLITLEDDVYDYRYHRYVEHNPPDTVYDYDVDVVEVLDEDGFNVEIVRILGKMLYVSKQFAGYKLTVNYNVTADRVDTIMLHKDGTYEYLESIDSTSPSHVDLADYKETFCIAVAYWQISKKGIVCDFFTNHRSYRKIYVDNNNVLYINGEVYKKQKFIYFEEPDERDREENDLWYNVKDNTLYIWRQVDGEWGWVIVNDHSEIIIKEKRIWLPEENPTDLQTFYFDDEEVNLHYVPNTNALDIIIDNAPLMRDQYTEITVTREEINGMQDQIDELELKIKNKKLELELLQVSRSDISNIIRALKKDLADSKTMYPAAYDINNKDYAVTNDDIDNLRNLMTIDQRVTKAVNDLSDLLTMIHATGDIISTYEEELKAMKRIQEGNYVSSGVGFKLKRPLSRSAYVEVTVTHQVRMKPARETFQRCAVFVKENDITVAEDGEGQVFRTTAGYSLGQEQLEVFVDGIKLSKGLKEFFEQVDHEKEEKPASLQDYIYNDSTMRDVYEGTTSYHFKVMNNLLTGQTVSYRISKQVWSYDQLDVIVSNIKEYARNAFSKAETALTTITSFQANITHTLNDILNDITVAKSEAKKVSQCYVRGEKISFDSMPTAITNRIVGMPIDIVRPAHAIRITLEGVSIVKDADGVITGGDIFNIYYVTPETSRILIGEGRNRDTQDIDYWIDIQGSDVIAVTLRDDLVASDALIYVKGFKRGVST